MVRAAVLKGKDPNHLIAEMEKIDRMGIGSVTFLKFFLKRLHH